jgi:CRISPR-associated endonuclease/helicase Cas3
MSPLTPGDFATFFEAVHEYPPFPWQQRLAARVIREGGWPSVLDLPTGSGKTAAIDIAVFHLALEVDRGHARRAPVRIAFIVDRRLVVDDAFARARRIEEKLAKATPGSAIARVAECLKKLSGDGPPLIARRLRGGIPREDDWARTPAQPTVLCSTVDQVGSRLLFRGYGISDRMKPVHAGLIGSDCLILLDEAHLAEPFRQTLGWVATYRSDKWRDAGKGHHAPWGVSLLTATPGGKVAEPFELDRGDYKNDMLARRLDASKPARLIGPPKSRTDSDQTQDEESDAEEAARLRRIVAEVQNALVVLKDDGIDKPAIGVVVNRVGRARAVFERLKGELHEEIGQPTLMIGPARPVDRDRIVEALDPIRTRIWKKGEQRLLDKPLVLVATQCIEAGVDIDLDALITEVAPLDALRQRLGRVNRAGREVIPYAAIVAARSDLDARQDDPVYGGAMRPTWDYLLAAARSERGVPIVDFGLNDFRKLMERVPVSDDTLSPKDDAPVLLPAHLDLLSQTSPIPAADPEVALYLHGTHRQPDSVTVVWRADVNPTIQNNDQVRRLLLLVPLRSAEAIELPPWAVQRWLKKDYNALDQLADVAVSTPKEGRSAGGGSEERLVFCWKGDDERSVWIAPSKIRPGDTIVVPADYGGMDEFGWNPDKRGPVDDEDAPPVADVAHRAAMPFAGRRFAVRLAPGLTGEVDPAAVTEALAAVPSWRWQDLRNAVADLALPVETKEALAALDRAKGRGNERVKVYDDLYDDAQGNSHGIVFVAPFGLRGVPEAERVQPATTEDDAAGSLPGFSLTLETHSADVENKAEEFARAASLPVDRVTDLKLTGYLHDAGKVDPRFQAWLHYGDPLGPDPDDPGQILAKSARSLPRGARDAAGLPENWRHEAFSVRLALHASRFVAAKDPELVLWLIGTHHGHGRPFFPHADPEDSNKRKLPSMLGLPDELLPGHGPQSLGFDWNGHDWAGLYECLKARYGVWELARMEAILRLADHRASEEAANREISEGNAE